MTFWCVIKFWRLKPRLHFKWRLWSVFVCDVCAKKGIFSFSVKLDKWILLLLSLCRLSEKVRNGGNKTETDGKKGNKNSVPGYHQIKYISFHIPTYIHTHKLKWRFLFTLLIWKPLSLSLQLFGCCQKPFFYLMLRRICIPESWLDVECACLCVHKVLGFEISFT